MTTTWPFRIDHNPLLKAGDEALAAKIEAARREPGFRPHRYTAQGHFLGEARTVIDTVTPLIVEQVARQIIEGIEALDPNEFATDSTDVVTRITRMIRDMTGVPTTSRSKES